MNLHECMQNQPADELIYIGASTSYFFIGYKDEYFNDIEKISKEYIDAGNRSYTNRKARLFWLQNKPIKIATGETYQYAVNERYRYLKNYLQYVNESKEYVESFTPLQTREVVEVSKKELFEQGIRILVKGGESGKWWFRNEYVTKTVQRDS